MADAETLNLKAQQVGSGVESRSRCSALSARKRLVSKALQTQTVGDVNVSKGLGLFVSTRRTHL